MIISNRDRQIAQEMNIGEDVLSIVRASTQAEISPLLIERVIPEEFLDYYYLNRATFPGEIVDAVTEEKAKAIKLTVKAIAFHLGQNQSKKLVITLQQQLEKLGYSGFIISRDYGPNQDKIGIFKISNPLDILTIQLTDGINYDVTNQDIANRLESWQQQCSFRLIGADYDWAELHFETLPEDINTFAEDIYEFCPDTLEQSFLGELLEDNLPSDDWEQQLDEQTTQDLVKYLLREKDLFLWWD
jgi:hypothetical protein